MDKEFDLESYLTHGVETIVANAIRATLKNPRESVFMARFALASKAASKKRREAEERSEYIPPFLIASITSSCNLHCAGCYARTNHACNDKAPVDQLTDCEWQHIFEEAKELGISFILLAGGEPMLRPDVITIAGNIPEILFPIFTNGTLMNDTYTKLFDKYRNLIPIFSIEGEKEITDDRRGEGIYDKLIESMERMRARNLIFGVSVTVTTANFKEVVSHEFLNKLHKLGCKAVFYVEFVPVTEESRELAPEDKERSFLKEQLVGIREEYQEMVFVSFPGDEKSSGGCLAAGRGFFHINSHGGAEPCPFSPYSDINVKETSIKEALNSNLFKALQSGNVLIEEHEGGCVLFERKEEVETIMKGGFSY